MVVFARVLSSFVFAALLGFAFWGVAWTAIFVYTEWGLAALIGYLAFWATFISLYGYLKTHGS